MIYQDFTYATLDQIADTVHRNAVNKGICRATNK
jgi:hypothetical protein